jgi:FKBP-type peptidyl-prolyl cis-trans isomerase
MKTVLKKSQKLSNCYYLLLILFLCSCLDDDKISEPYKHQSNPTEEAELAKLKTYMDSNYPNVTPEESGLYVVKKEATTKQQIYNNDSVLVYIEASFIDGEKWSSNTIKYNDFDDIKVAASIPVSNNILKGIKEGLTKSRLGEKIKLFVPSKLAYGSSNNYYNISKFTTLVYDYQVLGINEQGYKQFESNLINDELKLDSIKNTAISNTGLVYKIIKQGTNSGERDIYNFKYEAKYFNESPIYFGNDYNKSGNLNMRIEEIKSPGIKEALQLIGKDGEILVYIPSYLLSGGTHQYTPIKMKITLNN